jgi:hypothetical protein
MSFSQEIQFKVAIDSSQAAAGFQKLTNMAQQAGQKMDAAMFGNISAARKLNDLKSQSLFNEMNTSEKIKSVTNDITTLSRTKNALEEGSTKNLQVQYAILQKQNQLKSLSIKQTKELGIESGGGGAGGGGGGGGGTSGESGGAAGGTLAGMIAGGMFKRLIFMGAGAIMAGAMQAVPAYFGRQVKREQEGLQLSEAQISNQEEARIATGGNSAMVKVAYARLRRGKEDISILQKEISDMESEFGFEGKMALNSDYKAIYEDKQSKLLKLKISQDEYAYSAEAANRASDRTSGMLDSEKRAVELLTNAQNENSLSAVEVAQIKLQKAKDVVNTLTGNTGMHLLNAEGQEMAKSRPTGTPEEIKAAKIARSEAQNSLRAAEMAMQQRQIDVSQTLSEQAAGSNRTFANGRPRPLSETERLARQAMQARQKATNAVLTGAPGEASYQQQRALGMELNVGTRLSFGSSEMQKRITPDSSAIAAEITTSNQLLEAIKNSLTPTVN